MAARALELTDFAVATMHMQGFSRMFRPANFAPSEADHEAVKARGREIYEKGLAVMDRALEGQDYLCGEFSIADSALFYVCFWWAARLGLPLPANVVAHYDRMKARPAVARTMAAEGLA
jgi:glutathione S-transferase